MGALILRARRAIPQTYRDLSASTRTLLAVCLPLLGVLIALVMTAARPDAAFWVRAEITFAVAVAAGAGLLSIRNGPPRLRTLRRWTALALTFWLLAEIIRDVELAMGIDAVPGASDIPLAGVLLCAGLGYSSALRGRLRPREEWAVYLDGGIVFFATAALIVTGFGDAASSTVAGTADLLYAVVFLAAAGATLVLHLAIRVERRPHGAYVLLGGLVLIGGGFLLMLLLRPAGGLPGSGIPIHLFSLGVVAVSLGASTWTDVTDDSTGYVRFAGRLRAAMPIVAVAVSTLLIGLHLLVLHHEPHPLDLISVGAIGVVIVLVAIRQSVLLYDREEAIGRERELSRELSRAEGKYRSLVERQPGGVYIAEPGALGRWFFVGPQVAQMLGYPPDAWTADPGLWARLIHPDDRDEAVTEDAEVGRPGTVKRLEYRMVRRDGQILWILDESTVVESDDGKHLLQGMLLDITAAKLAEEALRASEEQQRMIIETASYAFVAIDGNGRVVDWNRHAEETFGWTREQALAAELAELIIPLRLRAAHRDGMRRYVATREGRILSRRMELEAVHQDGHEFPVELTIWPVWSGESVRFNALIDDITVRKELEEQLRHQALHDSLTGLANRALFSDRVQHAIDRSSQVAESSLAVLFLDLDDFKTVNDSLGHSAGDELLVGVGRRLEENLRPGDTAARLGGDEFGILLEDVESVSPQAVATRLLEAFEPGFVVQGKHVQVHASIGIASDTAATTGPDELLRNADLAMYVAKQRGKRRYETYVARMHEETMRRLELKAGLERAIAEEQLEVHYQPIVELMGGAVIGFEALLRWRDPTGRFVPLSELIPLAEETGL
ncbi:MAG: putative bifunctional diguanylate cyclase/phosphodiesterase, partial [Candidatus Limnocylindria bacterium]